MSKKNDNEEMYVVGIGASAGGLESISDLLSNLPDDIDNVAFIIAQHLSPNYKSMLSHLLSRETKLNVQEVNNGITVKNRNIYITPPDSEITYKNNKLWIVKPKNKVGPKPSVDVLFYSIAAEKMNLSIGIILSGTGSDGSKGIRSIKKSGGITIAQEPKSAKYDGMPLAAIETGHIDFILSPSEIGNELLGVLENSEKFEVQTIKDSSELPLSMDKIFRLMSKRTGTDFSNYKPTTLFRRIQKRLASLNLDNLDDYLNHIEKNPNELDSLFNIILIGVTAFFRDPEAFAELEKQLAQIISNKSPGDSIRIWVPGCATGEEPYTIGIILSKLLKGSIRDYNIQVFATDIDEKAITIARRGIYPPSSLENVAKEIIENYFLKKGDEYELLKSIRAMVLFSKHDVTSNPPFLKLDLISCRNLLIYFGINLQRHIMPVFHYALNPEGILFLGKSETVGQFSDIFKTIDGKYKIYRQKSGVNLGALKVNTFRTSRINDRDTVLQQRPKDNLLKEMVKDALFRTLEYPYVIINDQMEIIEIKGDVHNYLGLNEGKMNLNIIKMAHKELQLELRSLLMNAVKNNVPVKGEIKSYEIYDHVKLLRVVVKPLSVDKDDNELFVVIFENYEVNRHLPKHHKTVYDDSENSRISELEHELAVTKENLQTYIEEVETSNEELQALNEELQSTNEELQSSNEELETSNEELSSTNEEIQIAYGELKSANEALEKKESLLRESESNIKALLNNRLQSSILIDHKYKIIAFNTKAEETLVKLYGSKLEIDESVIKYLEPSEMEDFYRSFKQTLNGKIVNTKKSVKSVKGELFWFHYNFTPVLYDKDDIRGVAFSMLDITNENLLKQELTKREKLLNSVFDTASIGIAIASEDGTLLNVNNEFAKIVGFNKDELKNKLIFDMIPHEDRKYLQNLYEKVMKDGYGIDEELQILKKDGAIREAHITGSLLEQEDNSLFQVISLRDISERKKYRNLLSETQQSVKVGGWELDLITNENTWTDEVYEIYDVPTTFEVNVEKGLSYYEAESQKILSEALKNAVEKGEQFDLELQFISEQSNRKWVRSTCKPIRVHHRTIKLFGTIQDITSRKTYEERLLRITQAVEKATEAVRIANVEGESIYINDGFKKLLGYQTVDELKAKGGFIKAFKDKRLGKEIQEKVKGGESWKGEIDLVSISGKVYPVSYSADAIKDDTGYLIGYISIFTDISVIKQNQEHLKMLESVVVNANDAVMITRFKKNSYFLDDIIYVNQAFCKMLGYTKEEIIGNNYQMMLGPGTDRNELKKMEKSLQAGRPYQVEIINYRKNGSELWASLSAVPVKTDRNKVNHFVTILRDVTDRKNFEEDIKRKNSDLIKANSELDKFVYSASHDLKAPLASVSGLIKLVKFDLKDEKYLDYLDKMETSISKLNNFINDIVNYSRNSRLEVQQIEVNLSELIAEVQEGLNYLENADKIQFLYNFDSLKIIKSDYSRLRVVISNLVSNAIKYHNLHQKNPYISIRTEKRNGAAVIKIEDNGLGINKNSINKIFDMFYRGSEMSNGSGLGLYIVKETIMKLQGQIYVESVVGEGTTFTVEIPIDG